MGLDAEIWACRLGEGGRRRRSRRRGRCSAPTLNYNLDQPKQGTGTADHLTLLRLFQEVDAHLDRRQATTTKLVSSRSVPRFFVESNFSLESHLGFMAHLFHLMLSLF